MTTFQVAIFSILEALSSLIPISNRAYSDFLKTFLDWPTPSVELKTLASGLTTLVLIYFFRFDWLGIFSAILKSIVKPKSLGNKDRTLDQQIVLFLLIAATPSILAQMAFRNQWISFSEEGVTHPLAMFFGAFLSMGIVQLGLNLNKRIRGLNHLRLLDGVWVGLLLLLSGHPAFSPVLLCFAGFAICHYHADALLKYSFLLVTLQFLVQTLALGSEVHVGQIFHQLGFMNGVVATVLITTTAWITIENFQKSFALNSFEGTFRFFRWFQLVLIMGYGVTLYFQRTNG